MSEPLAHAVHGRHPAALRVERRAVARDAPSMRRALLSPWAWGPPVLGVLLLALLLGADADRTVFFAINGAGRALGQAFWAQMTLLGDGAVALALVLPSIRRAPRVFWAALVAALVATIWVQALKHAIVAPRPLAVLAPGSFVQAGPPLHGASFPSGHAAAAFALGGVWAMTLRAALLRIAVLLLAALVALSRMMVGAHWPVDILGGMLGGWLGAWTGLALAGRRGWHTRGAGALAAGALLLALCATLLVSRHTGMPAALPLQRLIGAVCLALGAREVGSLWALLRARGGPHAARRKRHA